MQVEGTAGLGDLPRHLVSDQSRQSEREIDQAQQIEPGSQARLVAQIDEVFGTDVAGGARRKWTSAEAAQRGVETARAGS